MCPEKSIFLWNCLKKSKIFGNFPRKSKYFGKLPKKSKFFENLTWKIESFGKITWQKTEIFSENSIFLNCLTESKFFRNYPRKSKFFDPGPRPSRFQTRLTPLSGSFSHVPSLKTWKPFLNIWKGVRVYFEGGVLISLRPTTPAPNWPLAMRMNICIRTLHWNSAVMAAEYSLSVPWQALLTSFNLCVHMLTL